MLDSGKATDYCEDIWQSSIIGELTEYIKVPNKSPAFDPDWQANGFMEAVVVQFADWIERQQIEGMQLDVVRLPGRTPLLFIEIPGESAETVLLYGHLDKQPEMTGWREDLGPWKPVLEGDRLYGRGGADDGYAIFSCLTAVNTLKKQGLPHARCIIIIEACEESGSYDLPYYIDALSERIGQPDLIICLDSGCGNYEQLWCTTSLRGLIGGELKVQVLKEGVHSGDASGVVPSSFRILRKILGRIDDAASGVITDPGFNTPIPEHRIEQARLAAAVLNKNVYRKFPFLADVQPDESDPAELILNRTWRPALSITGADGLPAIIDAGNVLQPFTAVKVSLRLPPTCNARRALKKLQAMLEYDPPCGARVTFKPDWEASGWHAPPMADWLEKAVNHASLNYFGKPAMQMGEGGSIPFMSMLGERFPTAQFMITGVLGPHSNAHGPNEFLHLPTAKKLTCCVAEVLARHFQAAGNNR